MSPVMLAAVVCREMKWTLDEYEAQPSYFIDVITRMLQAEADESRRQNK